MTHTATRYLIELDAKGPDAHVRLRQLLKVARRRFGIVCTGMAEAGQASGSSQTQTNEVQHDTS